jgi:prevent-host-death family protein
MRNEPVTELKLRADELLSDLERDKEPILITSQGVPSAYLVDVVTYEFQQTRIAILEGILKGERDIAEGRTLTHQEVEKRMER